MMNNWINYHHLLYFKTIAEEQSVSKAAIKLKLGQPTLSAQLKQFEDNLDVSLFERQHKKLILTEQGQVALEYAQNIFSLGSEMVEVLHDRLKQSKTAVCIGALDTVPKEILLKLTLAAKKNHNCKITLLEGSSDELIRELLHHKIDILVSNFIPTGLNEKKLFHKKISQTDVAIYGSNHFKSLQKNFPKSLDNQPMILPTYNSKLRYDLDHWSKLNKIQYDLFIESQDISVKKLLAVNGLGLLAATNYSVEKLIKKNELIKIGSLDGVTESLYLLSAERKIENSIARDLMKTFVI